MPQQFVSTSNTDIRSSIFGDIRSSLLFGSRKSVGTPEDTRKSVFNKLITRSASQPNLEKETTSNEKKCRESIQTLIDSGLLSSLNIFRRISRHILDTKSVYPRHVEFISRIESELLSNKPKLSSSNAEWIRCFRINVINNPLYKLDDGNTNLVSSFTSMFSSEYNNVKRFHYSCESLVLMITDANGDPLKTQFISSHSAVGPFSRWILEIDNRENESVLSANQVTSPAIWSGSWGFGKSY